MIKALYKQILSNSSFFSKQETGKWVTRSEALFAVFENNDGKGHGHIHRTVERLLLDCGENIVVLPDHLLRVLEYMNQKPIPISASLVRGKLRKAEKWKDYSADEKLQILTFILEDRNYKDLKDIELLRLNNGTFTSFSGDTEDNVFVVQKDVANLFPGLEKNFTSQDMFPKAVWITLTEIAEQGNKRYKYLNNYVFINLNYEN